MNRQRVSWKRVGYAVAALAVVAAVAVGVVAARDNNEPATATPVSRSSGKAVNFKGTDPITGKTVDLAAYAGKPVVINIWASWCPGCNQEASDLARFVRAHPETQVVGVDTNDEAAAARGFYRRWGWQHPSVFDPSGSLASSLGLQGLPTTIFLDRHHRRVTQIIGASNLAGFDAGLHRALQAS